jgi:hypothetical protein
MMLRLLRLVVMTLRRSMMTLQRLVRMARVVGPIIVCKGSSM